MVSLYEGFNGLQDAINTLPLLFIYNVIEAWPEEEPDAVCKEKIDFAGKA